MAPNSDVVRAGTSATLSHWLTFQHDFIFNEDALKHRRAEDIRRIVLSRDEAGDAACDEMLECAACSSRYHRGTTLCVDEFVLRNHLVSLCVRSPLQSSSWRAVIARMTTGTLILMTRRSSLAASTA